MRFSVKYQSGPRTGRLSNNGVAQQSRWRSRFQAEAYKQAFAGQERWRKLDPVAVENDPQPGLQPITDCSVSIVVRWSGQRLSELRLEAVFGVPERGLAGLHRPSIPFENNPIEGSRMDAMPRGVIMRDRGGG